MSKANQAKRSLYLLCERVTVVGEAKRSLYLLCERSEQ